VSCRITSRAKKQHTRHGQIRGGRGGRTDREICALEIRALSRRGVVRVIMGCGIGALTSQLGIKKKKSYKERKQHIVSFLERGEAWGKKKVRGPAMGTQSRGELIS